QNAVLSVVVGSVLITAVVAVLVTAAEAFSEVVVVRTLVFAIAVISVVRVLVGIGIAVVEVPAIFTVRDTRAIAFPIAVVHRPPQQVRTVLVDLVVRRTAVRAITAVLHSTTEISDSKPSQGTTAKRKYSLKQHLLEKMKTWINSLLEGERDEFLGRDRHARLDQGHDNYRNGYRPRRINFFGLGEIELKVPRDRQGEFTSQWLPERKGQDPELEA